VTIHPLIERAKQPGARQAKGFREVAAGLTGEVLLEDYRREVAAAPRRTDAGKRYFAHRTRPRRTRREGDQCAMALARRTDDAAPLRLPDGGTLEVLDHHVPLQSAAPDAAKPDDPNRDVGRVDLLGLDGSGRLVVVDLRFVAPDATRAGTGETPLRALLELLAKCAAVYANRDAIAAEIGERFGRTVSEEPPVAVLLGTARYWELCRKREAQKGAAWIHQMERLAHEIEESIGVPVRYWALSLEGDPAWTSDDEAWPRLVSPPRIEPAWSEFAGRVRPKPRPRSRPRPVPAESVVEADLSRPVRSYAMGESFEVGDRVDHPSFGVGVVQGAVGPGKIKVRFGEEQRVLVHGRSSG
jgi:hypothetical protein